MQRSPSPAVRRPGRIIARTIARITGGLLMLLGLAAFAVFLAVQEAPDAPSSLGPPQQSDANHARNTMLMLEHMDRLEDRRGTLSGEVEEWNGLFRILARSDPRLRAQARVEDGELVVAATVALPRRMWPDELSLRAVVPPFEGTPRLSSLRIGRLPLPPMPTLQLGGALIDRHFGAGTMEAALASLRGVEIEGEEVRFDVVLPTDERGAMTQLLLTGGSSRPLPDIDEVVAFVTAFDRLAEEGALPRDGSFLPWIQATVDLAIRKVDAEDPGRTLLAAFLALDRLCGSGDLARLLPAGARMTRRDLPSLRICGSTGLHGRRDLRQHFVTAGTVKLLANRGVAVTVGEIKELSDMDSTGFDFTDIMGNNSGIRFATLLNQTPPAQWRDVRDRITGEPDVIGRLDGLPQGMSASAFRLRFGDVNSPEHAAVVEEIEARIDRLPLHSGAPASAQGG